MEYSYIKFDFTNNTERSDSSNILISIIKFANKLYCAFCPNSDPDYDEGIYKVKRWLVEFEKSTEHPYREIGIDQNNNVIVKSPWVGRYAYWADLNLKLADFKRQFNATEVNRQEFELLWNSFNLKN